MISLVNFFIAFTLFAAVSATQCVPQTCRCKVGATEVKATDANGCATCFCVASGVTPTTTVPPTTQKATTTTTTVTRAGTTVAITTTTAATTLARTTAAPSTTRPNLCPNPAAVNSCNCKPGTELYYTKNWQGCDICGCRAVSTTAPTTRATSTVATTTVRATTTRATTTRATTTVATTTAPSSCGAITPCRCKSGAIAIWQADGNGCPFCSCQATGSSLAASSAATSSSSSSSEQPVAVPIAAALVALVAALACGFAVYRFHRVNGRFPWQQKPAELSMV